MSISPIKLYFYSDGKLSSELKGDTSRCIFGAQRLALVEHVQKIEGRTVALLSIDAAGTALQSSYYQCRRPFVYTAFGGSSITNGLMSLLGFNGEHSDPATDCYLLGNGHRGYDPVLMRFRSPDKLSPFGKGEINAYSYCSGDPVNFVDPTGNYRGSVLDALREHKARLARAHLKLKTDQTPNVMMDDLLIVSDTDSLVVLKRATKNALKLLEQPSEIVPESGLFLNDQENILILRTIAQEMVEAQTNYFYQPNRVTKMKELKAQWSYVAHFVTLKEEFNSRLSDIRRLV